MHDLVLIKHNDVFTDSMVIAEGTGNTHRAIYLLIEKYENRFKKFGRVSFEMTPLMTKGGMQEVKIYQLNEQQATFLMTLLRNSEKVVDFKFRITQEFFKMRQLLMQKQTVEWQESRTQGKLTRKSETDVIKELVEYAKAQGSNNYEKLYTVYSKLANKKAGITDKSQSTVSELNNLALIENIILHVIREGMILNKPYKEIYQDCKNRLDIFNKITYLTA